MATDKPDLNAALIAGLAVEAQKLTAEGQSLISELHTRGERLQRIADSIQRSQKVVAGFFVVAVLLLASQAVVGLTNRAALNNGHKILNRIQSCTTPSGACSQQSSAQTEVALERLALAFCAGIHPHDPAGAQQCGVAALAALRGKP